MVGANTQFKMHQGALSSMQDEAFCENNIIRQKPYVCHMFDPVLNTPLIRYPILPFSIFNISIQTFYKCFRSLGQCLKKQLNENQATRKAIKLLMKNLASSYNNQRSTEQTILVYAGSSSNKKSDNDFKYWPEFFNDSAFSHQFSFTVNNKDLN